MINKNSYTSTEINNALLATNRSVKFRFDLLNRYGINQGSIDGLTEATIQYGNLRPLKGTANFSIGRQTKEIDWLNEEIQPWFILNMPNGGKVEWSMGIYRLPIVPDAIEGLKTTKSISGFDRTIKLKRWRFTSRYFIPKGTEYSAAIIQILTLAKIKKFDIPFSGARIATDREIAIGLTALEVINDLCNEINYNGIRADLSGTITTGGYILPDLRQITKKYIANKNSIIIPRIESGLDITEVANVFIRVAENVDGGESLVGIYRNDDPMSKISTVNQDEIMDYATIDNIASQEILDARVKRIAVENSSKYTHVNFSTALMPDHGDQDVIYLDLANPKFRAEIARRGEIMPELFKYPQKLFETGWEMQLRPGGEMTHETRRVIRL